MGYCFQTYVALISMSMSLKTEFKVCFINKFSKEFIQSIPGSTCAQPWGERERELEETLIVCDILLMTQNWYLMSERLRVFVFVYYVI